MDVVEAYLRDRRAAGMRQSTARLRGYQLRSWERSVGHVWAATPAQAAAWLDHPAWAPETRHSRLSALKGLYRWGLRAGLTGTDPTVMLDSVPVPRAVARPCPAPVVERALMTAPRQVAAMLLLAYDCGLRRAEIAGFDLGSVDGRVAAVVGKGGHGRLVVVTGRTRAALGPAAAGWAFPAPGGGHLSPDRVGRAVAAALGGGWTAHTLRHAFATRAYERAGDIVAVQQLLGHASVATTQRYIATDLGRLLAAAGA